MINHIDEAIRFLNMAKKNYNPDGPGHPYLEISNVCFAMAVLQKCILEQLREQANEQ